MVGDIPQPRCTRRSGRFDGEWMVANHLIFKGILKHFELAALLKTYYATRYRIICCSRLATIYG